MVLELQKPRPIWQIMFSTHHTDVGLLYLIMSLGFLFLGGALALVIRAELFLPGAQIIGDAMTFNRIFTVHGTTLIFLFIIPFASAVGNYYVPIMVRYKDMAYPKLNAIAFWMIPPGGALIWLGFADFTWYATPPYSIISAPGPAADMWIFGLKILGISSVLGAINFVVTILKCKHPDMSIGQVPLLAWSFLSSSLIILVAIPTFAAALLMLLTDRLGVSGFFNPAMGGDPIAYAHLFWFTFHPEVYVLVIPAIGMMYEIIPRFSRKPIYSFNSGIFAFVLLSIVGFLVMGTSHVCNRYVIYRKNSLHGGNTGCGSGICNARFQFYCNNVEWYESSFRNANDVGSWGNCIILLCWCRWCCKCSYAVGLYDSRYVLGSGSLPSLCDGYHCIWFNWVCIYYMFPYVTGRMYNETMGKVHFHHVFCWNCSSILYTTCSWLVWHAKKNFRLSANSRMDCYESNCVTVGAMVIGVSMAIFLVQTSFTVQAKENLQTQMTHLILVANTIIPFESKNPSH